MNSATNASLADLFEKLVDIRTPQTDPEVWARWTELAKERIRTIKTLRIDAYHPQLNYPSAWLAVVESRIRSSITSGDIDANEQGEWLSEAAGNAAIMFLRAGADVLPSEPHIYGTDDGDFVAEFEADDAVMTSVVTGSETTLFGVRADDPERPIHMIIPRGSNHYHADLRHFTRKLTARPDGKMASG